MFFGITKLLRLLADQVSPFTLTKPLEFTLSISTVTTPVWPISDDTFVGIVLLFANLFTKGLVAKIKIVENITNIVAFVV